MRKKKSKFTGGGHAPLADRRRLGRVIYRGAPRWIQIRNQIELGMIKLRKKKIKENQFAKRL